MYDTIIITHIPVFYKINLYNEIVRNKKILVLFIASNTIEKRSDDFICLDNAKFEYQILTSQLLQNRSALMNILNIRRILRAIQYKRIIVGGWDLLEYWYIALSQGNRSLALTLESSVIESSTIGFKGLVKKLFLSRISIVFASGRLHGQLLEALGYKNKIIITQGVGIINKPIYQPASKEYNKQFLFIGRLSTEKNIGMLVKIFNGLDDHQLTIVGVGDQKDHLMGMANKNISFIGAIDNKNLVKLYQENDLLVLSSTSEPWGLVVEEALYFGLPVLVSKNCGSSELVTEGVNGFTFDPYNIEELRALVEGLDDSSVAGLRENIQHQFIDVKDDTQVACYD